MAIESINSLLSASALQSPRTVRRTQGFESADAIARREKIADERAGRHQQGVVATISKRGAALSEASLQHALANETYAGRVSNGRAGLQSAGASAPQAKAGPNNNRLSKTDTEQVRELEKRDKEVRSHEAAHHAAAGAHAKGGPQFSTTSGPDGKQYATGGEVSIDTSAVKGDPDATIRKMEQVKRAASAPASPSSQDRAVAAEASQKANNARVELQEERRAEREEQLGGGDGSASFASRIERAYASGGTPEARGRLSLRA